MKYNKELKKNKLEAMPENAIGEANLITGDYWLYKPIPAEEKIIQLLTEIRNALLK